MRGLFNIYLFPNFQIKQLQSTLMLARNIYTLISRLKNGSHSKNNAQLSICNVICNEPEVLYCREVWISDSDIHSKGV